MKRVQFLFKHFIRFTSIIVLALTIAAACADDPDEPPPVFSGLILGFAPRSLLEFESITVIDESGTVMELRSGGRRFSHFTPSHIREHMVLGPRSGRFVQGGRRRVSYSRDHGCACG